MSKRRVLALAVGMTAALAIGEFAVLGQTPKRTAAPATEGQPELGKGRAQEFIAAFNKGDAKAVAAFWTADGDYIDQVTDGYAGWTGYARLRPPFRRLRPNPQQSPERHADESRAHRDRGD